MDEPDGFADNIQPQDDDVPARCSRSNGFKNCIFKCSRSKLRKKWIVAVRYDKWVPKEFSVVCNRHFKQTDFVVSPTFADFEAKSIQAIDRKSVHQICSGQVVLTLATAVKELVENSIDAGATTVDVKLKEYGSECIEVTDNGSGVEDKNFEGLTLKHHTSKLSDFSDLINVATFGFRGEALSSLCALSNMVVVTRHASAAVGTRLEFDADGKIVSRTPVPRQQGTTVTLQNLFHTLPVRHREFLRNLKKEFGKMIQVLNAYCLVNTGVRITCSNQTAKGSRSTIVSTSGNATVKDNIANIFGQKQLQSLLPFEQHTPSEDVCSDYGIRTDASHTELFRLEGFVSKCEHGQGRSSTDRQFLFINRRPCDATKILKVINEVYHSYNRHQYPFVVLLISMAKESVDVNVTPDKRQIFVEGEKILLATLKTSLIHMFEPTTSVLRVNMIPHQPGSSSAVNGTNDTPEDAHLHSAHDRLKSRFGGSLEKDPKDGVLSSLARLKRSFSSAFDKSDRNSITLSPELSQPDKQRKLDKFFKKSSSTPPAFNPDAGSIKQFFSSACSPSKKSQADADSKLEKSHPQETEDVVFVEHSVADGMNQGGESAVNRLNSTETDEDEQNRVNLLRSTVTGQDEQKSHNPFSPTMPSALSSGGHCGSERVNHQEPNFNPTTAESLPRETDEIDGSVTAVSSVTHVQTLFQDSETSLASQQTVIPTEEKSCTDTLCDEDKSAKDENSQSMNTDVYESSSAETGDEPTLSTHFGKHQQKLSPSQDIQSLRSKSSSLLGNSTSSEQAGESRDCLAADLEAESTAERSAAFSITVTEFDQGQCGRQPVQEKELPFSFKRLQECLCSPEMQSKPEKKGFARSFRAKIRPDDNQSAEEELKREISKDMFEQMEVLGQFNLGFIIAKNGQDLFIVDQHATDEKYNFEMLQRHTVIQSQQLIHPQNLELTASNEIILMDNLDIFKKNGFDFIVNEEAPPTQRVKLKSTPISKNWNFGKDDIEELIFMLTDAPGIMCRPSRVRMMFASRACRKSIMIGTALNRAEMKKLLCHMGEIEQPWNCPHGRPTMRHLINLDMLPT